MDMARILLGVGVLTVILGTACIEATITNKSADGRRPTDNNGTTSGTGTVDSSDDGTHSSSEESTVTESHSHETASESDTTSEGNTDTGPDCVLDALQDFSSQTLPTGWSIVDGDNDGYTWQWSGNGNDIGVGSGAGHYWIDATDSGSTNMNEQLTTEEFTRGGCTTVTLYFTHRFDRTSDQGRVSIQVDGGDWKTLRNFYADDSGSEMINITTDLGAGAKFRIEFNYEGVGTQYWRVDDVRVVGAAS